MDGLELKLEFMECLCWVREFTINGEIADPDEFGDQKDVSPDTAEKYGCGDMQFIPKPSTPEVLAEYKITEEEYQEICKKLKRGLSFGRCGWCV